jgi:hypothetical protein
MVKQSSKNCSQCCREIDAKKSREVDALLKASINTPPLTLKELKAKLKKERERKNGSK